MGKTSIKNYIKIKRDEYTRLKKLQKNFESFWDYFTHLKDIEEGRKDIKRGKIIAQENLFRKLGL